MDLRRLRPNAFTSVTVDIPIESVWMVAANPLHLPEFSSELQSVRLLGSDPVGLGSRFEGDQLRGDRRWTTTSTITKFDEPLWFEWTVGDTADPVSRWSFLLDEHAAGTTICHKVVLCGGPSPLGDRITQSPAEAEELVQDRLIVLRERMSVTLTGLIGLAGRLEEDPSSLR